MSGCGSGSIDSWRNFSSYNRFKLDLDVFNSKYLENSFLELTTQTQCSFLSFDNIFTSNSCLYNIIGYIGILAEGLETRNFFICSTLIASYCWAWSRRTIDPDPLGPWRLRSYCSRPHTAVYSQPTSSIKSIRSVDQTDQSINHHCSLSSKILTRIRKYFLYNTSLFLWIFSKLIRPGFSQSIWRIFCVLNYVFVVYSRTLKQ